MKIEFEDKSYIEFTKSPNPDKVFISVAAKSSDNKNKLLINTVELSTVQLLSLFKSVS